MAIQAMHSESNRDALIWAKMLTDPSDILTRAPSSTPFLASKARFVRSFDIPYSSTDQGNFTVAAIPSSQVCAVIGTGSTIVAAAVPASLQTLVPAYADEGSSYLSNSMLSVTNRQTAVGLGTISFTDGLAIHPALAGVPVLRVATPNPTNPQVRVSPASQSTSSLYWRLGYVTAGTGVITWSGPSSLNAGLISPGNQAADNQGLVIQLCTSNSTPVTNRPDLKCTIYITNLTITSAISTNAQSFTLLSSDVLDAGKIGNHRCTAMSMLVTNMAPPLISGGELVAARCPFSVVASGVPTTIMTTIKQLPEERYWRSGSIKDGSYAWWLPDDLNSYEPNPYPEASQPENVLVAAGTMSDPGGFVRVLITYIFEFYTPVQLFARDYNFTYNPMVQDMWSQLVMRSAVSANAGHLALIAGATAVASAVYNFYQANRSLIDPLAKAGIAAAQKKLAKRTKQRKDGQKKGAPPLPPRPKAGNAQVRAKSSGAVS